VRWRGEERRASGSKKREKRNRENAEYKGIDEKCNKIFLVAGPRAEGFRERYWEGNGMYKRNSKALQ
jgi:hypothetical protein